MKKYLSILILLLTYWQGTGQKAEQVRSIAEVYHDKAWFKTQAKLWRQEVNKRPLDENAWLNLHLATIRAVGRAEGPEGKPARDLIEEIGTKLPNSFVHNYAKGDQCGSWNTESLKYLEKAYALQPNNLITYPDLIVNYEVYDLPNKRKALNKKWFESGKYSTGLLNYHRNVLLSLQPNAVIFTGGDNDTFPLWMLQDVKNLRTDVIVINRHLVGVEVHLKQLFQELGIELSEAKLKELQFKENTPDNIKKRVIEMVKIIDEKTNRPIYFTTSFTAESMKPIANNMYLVGLVNRYSKKNIDNLALLKKHFLNDYHLDYLESHNYVEYREQWVNWINQGYISGLLTLHKHFKNSQDYENMIFCKKYLRLLAEHSSKKKEILTAIE